MLKCWVAQKVQMVALVRVRVTDCWKGTLGFPQGELRVSVVERAEGLDRGLTLGAQL